MTTAVAPLGRREAWKALGSHHTEIRDPHLRQLFADDPRRSERMAAEAVGVYFDYSKNRVTDETLRLLLKLAEESGLASRIDAMFRGEKINVTEKRAALHVALRAPKGQAIFVDGSDVVPQVHAVLYKMTHFCDRVRGGEWKGHTGRPIRNVINIGIVPALLAAEITARLGRDPGELYDDLTRQFGSPVYDRVEAPATREQKQLRANLSPQQVKLTDLAGEKIQSVLTNAPGNDAFIGGLKVIAENG